MQLQVIKLIERDGKEIKAAQVRDGFIWSVKATLANEATPPEAAMAALQFSILTVAISEFYDKDISGKAEKAYSTVENAKKALLKSEEKAEKRKLVRTVTKQAGGQESRLGDDCRVDTINGFRTHIGTHGELTESL